jgi:hypothetical protein
MKGRLVVLVLAAACAVAAATTHLTRSHARSALAEPTPLVLPSDPVSLGGAHGGGWWDWDRKNP